MKISQHHHCELCAHKENTLQQGNVCGLDGEKPAFNRICSKILLNEKFEEKVKKVNIEYQNIKRQKLWTLTYTIVFSALGVLCFYLLYLYEGRMSELLANANSDKGQGMLMIVYILIIAAGIFLISLGFRAFITYRNKLAATIQKKNKVDAVLSLYNISYNIDIEFGRKYHGVQEVAVDLKVRGVLNK